jgi:hypothetical protein
MSWLWSLLAWLAGKIFGGTPAPSAEAVQAKQAGEAEQAVSTDEKALANVQAAREASDASIKASIADPSSLRLPDPDSRD